MSPTPRHRILPLLAWLLAAAAVATGAVGWYISGRIGNEALRAAYDHGPPQADDAVVEAVSESTITLRPAGDDSSRVRRGPQWGIRWAGGWGRAGRVLGASVTGVTRVFAAGEGMPRPGTPVDLTFEVERTDPLRACALPFQTVAIQSALGAEPAWLVPGGSSTWAIFVHGKGADRTQSLPTLSFYAARGFPCLVISYRNDGDAPASPDGRYHYGLTEWHDLEAACRYAVARGAEHFVLVGDSMGGGIVLAFLEDSPLAARVRAAVLDAPVVDFGRTIDLGIRLSRLPVIGAPLPPFSGALGKELASLRFGVNWSAYDLLRRADRIHAPLLVFHGDMDDVVPFTGSLALAALRPDFVRLERFHGARHLECWHLDRTRYESALGAFLQLAH